MIRFAIDVQPSFLVLLAETELSLDSRIHSLKESAIVEITGATVDLSDTDLFPEGVEEIFAWNIGDPFNVIMGSESPAKAGGQLSVLGTPSLYHIVGDTAYFRPTPDQDYTTRVVYRPELQPLRPDNQNNWLADEYPAVYWYACLEQAAPFFRAEDMQRVQGYLSKKDTILDSIANRNDRREYGDPVFEGLTLGGAETGW